MASGQNNQDHLKASIPFTYFIIFVSECGQSLFYIFGPVAKVIQETLEIVVIFLLICEKYLELTSKFIKIQVQLLIAYILWYIKTIFHGR